jgi:ferrous iron transport protein A
MNNMNNNISHKQSPTEQSSIEYAQKNGREILFDFSTLSVGDKGIIAKIQGQHKQRLMILGLTPNTHFNVVRVAPLGDPIEISFRGFSLTLRRDELEGIKVAKA